MSEDPPTVGGMNSRSRPLASLLVTDLDNTVWDWFAAWHATFAPMLRQLSERTGMPEAALEKEIRAVHQARGTAEYSALLAELPSLQRLRRGSTSPLQEYDDIVHVMNSARRRSTRLYPGVLETLTALRDLHVPVVAYTESVAYWTEWRLKHTGLDGVIDVLYSSVDHDLPSGITLQELRRRPQEDYGLKQTEHMHVPVGVTKPDVSVLRTILEDHKVEPFSTVYVGDSLTKDIVMAQAAGVHDVHARYGVADGRTEYDLLRRVSHWTDVVIEREREAARGTVVTPRYSIDTFAELRQLFDFQPSNDAT